ncbi:MAG: helix-turn-helix transcriptional regulator [Clostridia bacterium]|nr:helix-turn-helix transcriptional regulator [Oscillospiraceae bacterium]MBR2411726.1 helix-turn-helix transcriptional regulator [Clostridia bacterium]
MIIKTAERIKYLREANSITQTELAKKLNVSRSGVNAWEMGISLPSLQNLIELSLLFHVSTDYLLGIDNKDFISLEHLDAHKKEIIRQLVDCLNKE